MFVLAVTGGIGSGKSTATRSFALKGAVVLDLDDMSKGLIGPGGPLAQVVADEFGEDVLGEGGGVDTAALASVAFASPHDAARLDRLVHPAMVVAVKGAVDVLEAQPVPPGVVVLDIPLLVEAPGFFEIIDAVLAISSDEDTRIERLVERGMGEADARARMNCQATDAERRRIADWVIDNDGPLDVFQHALDRFWEAEVAPRVT